MEIFSKMIATALNIAVHQVENTLSLLSGGATIPFISRYRKEATGGLDEVQIGDLSFGGPWADFQGQHYLPQGRDNLMKLYKACVPALPLISYMNSGKLLNFSASVSISIIGG